MVEWVASLPARRTVGEGDPPEDMNAIVSALKEVRSVVDLTSLGRETLTKPSRHVLLASGGMDETASGGSTGTATRVTDPQYVESGSRSWRIVSSGASSAQLRITPGVLPITFPEASAVCARVFVPDVSKVSLITIDIYGDPNPHTFSDSWSRNTGALNETPLVPGWNTIRFNAASGRRIAGKWGNVYRLDVTGFNAAGTAGSEFVVDRVWVETPEQASICVIADGPYTDFMKNAYPDLRDRGIPVTWATSVLGLGTSKISEGINMSRMTEAELASVAFENGNSVSAHSWGDLETEKMTADQIEADVIRTTRWLQSRGYTGHVWRAAWWQNRAPQHAAARPFYVGEASYHGASGVTPWPPQDMHNIPRMPVDTTVSNALMDSRFQTLKETKGLILPFFHRVAPNPGTYDTGTDQWHYFLEHVDEGISEGWLRADTFETLFARIGGTFREGVGGGTVAEYVNSSGEIVTKRLP